MSSELDLKIEELIQYCQHHKFPIIIISQNDYLNYPNFIDFSKFIPRETTNNMILACDYMLENGITENVTILSKEIEIFKTTLDKNTKLLENCIKLLQKHNIPEYLNLSRLIEIQINSNEVIFKD